MAADGPAVPCGAVGSTPGEAPDPVSEATGLLLAWGAAVERWRAVVAELLTLCRADALALELLAREPMTPGQLGASLGLTSSGVATLANRLEGRGYLVREPHGGDRRSLLLVAAPAGALAVGRRYRDLTRRLDDLFASADPHRMWILAGFLDDAVRLTDSQTRGLRDEIAARDRHGRDNDHEALWH